MPNSKGCLASPIQRDSPAHSDSVNQVSRETWPATPLRVGIIGLMHESNTFVTECTHYADFAEYQLLRGAALYHAFKEAHHEIGGFFEGLSQEGLEAVPLYFAAQQASGVVTHDALKQLWGDIATALAGAGRLDGLLLAAHGAAVSELEHDMDGYWLSRVRAALPNVPLICTIDPHANVSARMAAAVNALIAYRTNPHIDQRARGLEAARLMARTLRGEVTPTQAWRAPGVLINIERQHTGEPPCQLVEAELEMVRRRPEVLSASFVLGFPYADVAELGASFVVVTDNRPDLAQLLADELAASLWRQRAQFVAELRSVNAALARLADAAKPVCLLDMGDNIGGGAPGDGTILARALLERGHTAFVCLYDPEGVQQARQAGVGAQLRLKLGGKVDARHGAPLELDVCVLSLHDGRFEETEPRHGGETTFDMGETALVQGGSLTVMLTSKRMAPFSLRQLTAFGVNPHDFAVIVAKGVHAPVAAYAPVCPTLLRVNTPGVTSADLRHFAYQRRPRPLYPLDE